MLAVFSGGPKDGQEMHVDPKPIIVFPSIPANTELVRWEEEAVTAPVRMKKHVYRMAPDSKLAAIRALSRTPTYISIQRSEAEVLYEYEGETRG